MATFWVDNEGKILLANVTAVEVPPNPLPGNLRQRWNFGTKTWGPPPLDDTHPDDALDTALVTLETDRADIGTGASVERLIKLLKNKIKVRP